jgi:carbamoyl-phosphate synthase large subunit
MQSDRKLRILIAGIAGASLGTEIAKSLRHAGGYEIWGCDISPLAFGHYDHNFHATYVIGKESYIANLLGLCTSKCVDCIIPGGDEPAVLIGRDVQRFLDARIHVCQNDPALVERLSHKGECFKILSEIGIRAPITRTIEGLRDLEDLPMPCIVKPATASGGSVFVFFAKDRDEANIYCTYLRNNGRIPVAQEYLSEGNGEYTVGVLSMPDGSCAGAIALRRSFDSKLSVSMRGEGFLISSGYSQGRIDEYPEVCATAKLIAKRLGSTGPLNIQGRISADGIFMPFEINPRFSASTFLRTLAGFNEVDYFTRSTLGLEFRTTLNIRPGWYLRTLSEVAVPLSGVMK